MRCNPFFSIAAALILSAALLQAAPDRGDKQNERGTMRSDRPAKSVQRIQPERGRTVRQPGTMNRVESKHEAPSRTKPQERRVIAPGGRVFNTYPTDKRGVAPSHRYPPGAKPLPYYHRPGYVIRTLPRAVVTLSIGGVLFYYADGIYYRHGHSGFIVTLPPVGLIITTLPAGYIVFVVNGFTYYYYASVYYVWDDYYHGYRVVDPPQAYAVYRPGDIVETLPDGAYSVTIDGKQYYRYGDIYFMQAIQGDRIVYIVVTP